MQRKTYDQNTDLELIGPGDLTPLADALTHGGLVLYYVGQREDGLWAARFTTADRFLEPDQGIGMMLIVIESLEDSARTLWTACTSRHFDISYDCSNEPWGGAQQLSAATLARTAAVNTDLLITIYPADSHLGSSPEEKRILGLGSDGPNEQLNSKQFYPGQLIGLVIGFTIGFLLKGVNAALPLSAFGYFIAKALLIDSNAARPRQVLYGLIACIIVSIGVGLFDRNGLIFLIYILLAVTVLKQLSR